MKKFLSVLLAVMMVLSTVSFALPSAVGTMDTAVEAPAVFEEVDETADLAAAITNPVGGNGDLIFELDFDNLANGTSIASGSKLNTIGATLNSEYNTSGLYLNLSQYGNAVVENGALKLEKTAKGKWPQVQVSNGTKNPFLSDGYIYMEADMKLDLTDTQTASVTLGLTGYRDGLGVEGGTASQCSVKTVHGPSDETWYSLNGTYALNDADGYTGLECVIYLPTYSIESTEKDYFYLDNLRLYYKPFEVDVTIKGLGKEVTKTYTTDGVSASVLSDALGLPYEYNTKSVKIGDKTYGANDTIYFERDCVAEIVVEKIADKWYNDEYGYAIFDLTFENETAGASAANSSNHSLVPYFSPVADKFLARDKSEWGFSINNNGVFVSDPTGAGKGMVGQGNASTGYPVLLIENTVNQLKRECWIDNDNLVLTLVYDFYSVGSAVATTERFGGRTDLLSWSNGQFTQSAPYNADAEDTCNEVSDKTVTNQADTWRTVVSTYSSANLKNLTSTNQISFIKAHVAAPKDVHYYDNVKVYFKQATAEVEINANGLPGVVGGAASNVATSGLTAKQILDKAGVDISGLDPFKYTVLGISATDDGKGKVYGLDETVNFAVDTTFYIIWEKVDMSAWVDSNKGILLFDIDFEDPRAASVFTPDTNNKDYKLSTFAKVNPFLTNTSNWALSTSGMDAAGIENGAFKFQWDGTGQWPQILVGNPTNNWDAALFQEHGTYYVHAEIKALDSVDANLTSIAITSNGTVDGAHKGPSGMLALGNGFYKSSNQILVDEWMVVDASNSTAAIDTDGIDNDDINKITAVFTHAAKTSTPGNYYLIDNIKLWWMPENIDVTIEGGKNENFEAVTFENIPTATTASELLAKMPVKVDDYGQLTGFADENGNKITDLKFATNTTLQPIWTPWNVLAEQQFTIAGEYYGGSKTQFGSNGFGPATHQGDGGSNVTKAYITSYSGKKEGDYGIYTTGGNLVYKQLTPTAGDSNVHSGKTITDDYTVAAVPQGSSNRVTINVNLPAGTDAKYVVVKYKFQNIPDLNSDFAKSLGATAAADGKSATYTTRTGATDTYSLLYDYTAKYYIKRGDGSYEYAGGEEFEAGVHAAKAGDGVTVDMSELEDEWIYDLVPIGDKTRTNGVAQVLIDRPAHFRDMITVWDYVLVVGEGTEDEPIKPELPEEPAPEYAPETAATTSVRNVAPVGIRFKADITAEVNAIASDYGWVVGRKDTGATEETLVIGAANTVTAYGRENGVDIKRFFEETDELKTFTAVVYNIPVGFEDDTICVKPFVIVDGDVFYGTMIAKTPRQVAEAHGVPVETIMKKA